jgi:hypothetical protein
VDKEDEAQLAFLSEARARIEDDFWSTVFTSFACFFLATRPRFSSSSALVAPSSLNVTDCLLVRCVSVLLSTSETEKDEDDEAQKSEPSGDDIRAFGHRTDTDEFWFTSLTSFACFMLTPRPRFSSSSVLAASSSINVTDGSQFRRSAGVVSTCTSDAFLGTGNRLSIV